METLERVMASKLFLRNWIDYLDIALVHETINISLIGSFFGFFILFLIVG